MDPRADGFNEYMQKAKWESVEAVNRVMRAMGYEFAFMTTGPDNYVAQYVNPHLGLRFEARHKVLAPAAWAAAALAAGWRPDEWRSRP